jgi:type I restriction enzyme S subunit
MKAKIIPSRWLRGTGRRLDPGPYLSGAVEAKELLRNLNVTKERLLDLTKGHAGGVYNGPQFSRNYVDSPDYGVPFLGSSSMLAADLSRVPLLRRRDAEGSKLKHLRVQEGMTLISCSGTVGRIVYTRSDMEKMWSSQHIMKIVPDKQKIPPGYLYAFLGSRFGVPMVTSGTYGAIIQHIEAEHIVDLPVPRLGPIETKVHELVVEASRLRTLCQKLLSDATSSLFRALHLQDITAFDWHSVGPDLGFATSKVAHSSLRALNFNPRLERLVSKLRSVGHRELGSLCVPGSLRRGDRYKRIDADPQFGVELIGQKQLFWLRSEGRYLARKVLPKDAFVQRGCILVAARGTLGENELYCRAEFVWGRMAEKAYSEDLLKILGDETKIERGYLFAFVRSESMFRMLRSISIGTKLQDHHPRLLATLPVPYAHDSERQAIHSRVVSAADARAKALDLEDEAINCVEREIAGGR